MEALPRGSVVDVPGGDVAHAAVDEDHADVVAVLQHPCLLAVRIGGLEACQLCVVIDVDGAAAAGRGGEGDHLACAGAAVHRAVFGGLGRRGGDGRQVLHIGVVVGRRCRHRIDPAKAQVLRHHVAVDAVHIHLAPGIAVGDDVDLLAVVILAEGAGGLGGGLAQVQDLCAPGVVDPGDGIVPVGPGRRGDDGALFRKGEFRLFPSRKQDEKNRERDKRASRICEQVRLHGVQVRAWKRA